MNLSNHIYRASRKYKIPARIYTAILMQESGYKLSTAKTVSGHVKLNRQEKLNYCTHVTFKEFTKCVKEAMEAVKTIKVITDYGIAQIHYKTVDSYRFDTELLLTDLKYSVNAGARVLGWFHKRYSKKESYWYVRYNVGTRPKHRIRTQWTIYKKLVDRYL